MTHAATILGTQDNGVTLGVIDKNLQFATDLLQVTFTDLFGGQHSVHAHKNGPFTTVDDIIAAHDAGVLHPYESHDAAIAYHEQRGDTTSADRLRAYTADNADDEHKTGEGS